MEYETSIYFFVKNLHLFFVENVFNFLRPNCTSDNTTEEESDAAKEARAIEVIHRSDRLCEISQAKFDGIGDKVKSLL